MIKKVNVTGVEAFKYLRSQLILGSTFLANDMQELPIEKGKVFAFVPEGISNETLFQFEKGNVYKTEKISTANATVVSFQNELVPFIVGIIHDFLKTDERNCCLFEEPNAKPSDPFVINSEYKYVSIKDDIFYFINKENNHVAEIETILKRSEAYYLLGVLTSLNYNNHKDFSPFAKLKPEIFKKIVRNTEFFFSSAYDFESYLMWSRIV